jgi:surfactin synthase thioesterase subunit
MNELRSQPQVRLFCFPYAGAGASVFRDWSSALPATIEVVPVQYPGRENRVRETLINRIERLVTTLRGELGDLNIPFAFFGHSMGALVSYELARKLHEEGKPGPVHLFVSGRRAPDRIDEDPLLHQSDNHTLIEKLREFEGTPEAIFQYPELLAFWVQIFRADLEACETYEYGNGTPLSCPITAFGGLEDTHVSQADIVAWQRHTRGEFASHMLPGNHFFLKQSREKLLNTICDDLNRAGFGDGLFGNRFFAV